MKKTLLLAGFILAYCSGYVPVQQVANPQCKVQNGYRVETNTPQVYARTGYLPGSEAESIKTITKLK